MLEALCGHLIKKPALYLDEMVVVAPTGQKMTTTYSRFHGDLEILRHDKWRHVP